MGYTTEFEGAVTVEPPLNAAERSFLTKFAYTRRMDRHRGPYFVDGTGYAGQDHEDDIIDYNSPPPGQPGLWCKWEPNEAGDDLHWNGMEKFYDSSEWMAYLIDHFLKPGAEASTSGDPQFKDFTFDHVVNGTIKAQGEDRDDRWDLVVKDNEVTVVEYDLVPRQA